MENFQTPYSGPHLNETAPRSPATAVKQASPTPTPRDVPPAQRTAKHDRHKPKLHAAARATKHIKSSKRTAYDAKRQPHEPRKLGTRSSRSSAAIKKSEADGRDRDSSDSGESESESDMESAAPEPPAILNPDPSCCDPLLPQADRYFFTPASSLPRWPAYLTTVAPFALCIAILGLGSRFLPPVFFVLTLTELYWLVHARKMILSRRYLSWLKVASMPPTVNLAIASCAAEALHRTPEHDMDSWFTCRLIWYLQCLAAHLAPLTRVVSGVLYHHTTVSESKTALDTRLPSQRGVKPTADCVHYDVWTAASLSSGISTVLLSSESVVRQLVPRLLPLCPSDRLIQSENMASRCANLIIRGSLAPEVQRGSARVAVIQCTAADTSTAVASSASAFHSVALQVPMVLLILCFFTLACPAGTRFGSAFGSHPHFLAHVLVAPIVEELLKLWLGKAYGIGRLGASLLYGCIEFSVGVFFLDMPIPSLLPAFFLHAFLGCVSTVPAIFLHSLFNIGIHLVNDLYATPRRPDGTEYCGPGGCPPPEQNGPYGSDTRYTIWTHRPIVQNISVSAEVDRLVAYLCPLAKSPYWFTFIDVFKKYSWFNPKYHCPATSYSTMAVFTAMAAGWMSPKARERARSIFRSTLYAVGYRVGEARLPEVADHSAKVTLLPSFFEVAKRVSASCTLGFALKSVVPPFPDFNHPLTALHGVLKRFCKTPPTPNARKLRRLRRFVWRYVRKHYVPISALADVSVPTWLKNTNYPQWRKDQLLACWRDHPWLEEGDFDNKGFVKKETYGAYKAARGINSRSDTFKCYSGPFFKLMEEQVYHQDCYDGERLTPGDQSPFIKHIPVHLRPEFLERMLGPAQGPYYETDYSEFEKHFTPNIMHALELVLYKHMLENFPEVYDNIERALSTTNVCRYRGFIIRVLGKRMSGDMCTSLGNGFSNLMLFKFVAHCKGGHAFGVVEGDDALFYSSVCMDADDFADIGFEIKIECYPCLHSSSFCGMLSSQDGIVLRNITRVIPKFGWSMSVRRVGGVAVRMGLLRARALSLAYECPQCPIIFALARQALIVTHGFRPIFEAFHHRAQVNEWVEQFGEAMAHKLMLGPTLQARVDFADKFDISVPCQLRAEEIFSQWDGEPLDHPFINSLFLDSPDMLEFAENNSGPSEDMVVDRADCLAL